MWLSDGLFTAVWRRVYGEGKITGLLGNRTFQAVIFILVQFALWCYKDHSLDWFTLAIAIWVYVMYWSRAIGCILDCGEAWWQNHESYKRWWTPIVNWIAHKLGLHKYYGAYDAIWMTFRYTLCLLPLIYWGHYIWIAGLFAAPIYYGCKWLFNKYPQMYKLFGDSKDLPEICFGFTSGVIFYLGW